MSSMFPREIGSPCPFCGGDYNLDVFEVWDDRTWQFDSCCLGSYEEALQWTLDWSPEEWQLFFAEAGLEIRRVLPHQEHEAAAWPIDYGITITQVPSKKEASRAGLKNALTWTEAVELGVNWHRHLVKAPRSSKIVYAIWNGRPGPEQNLIGVATLGATPGRMAGTRYVPSDLIRGGDEYRELARGERYQVATGPLSGPRRQVQLRVERIADVTMLSLAHHRFPAELTWKASSALYKRAARDAKESGHTLIVSYVLESESGMSLRYARWKKLGEGLGGGQWASPSRSRSSRSGEIEAPKSLFGKRLAPTLVDDAELGRRRRSGGGQLPLFSNPPCHSPKKAEAALRKVVDPKSRQCYPASEAFYHAVCGQTRGYTPVQAKHEGISHWWVRGPQGKITDLTAKQFRKPVPYDKGRGRGWQTKKPSKRAVELMRKARLTNPGDAGARGRERDAAEGGVEEAIRLYQSKLRTGQLFEEVLGLMAAMGDEAAIALTGKFTATAPSYPPDLPGQRPESTGEGEFTFAELLNLDDADLGWRGCLVSYYGPTASVLLALGMVDYYVFRYGTNGELRRRLGGRSASYYLQRHLDLPTAHVEAFAKFLVRVATVQNLTAGHKTMGVGNAVAAWVNMTLFRTSIPSGATEIWPIHGFTWIGQFLDEAAAVVELAGKYGDDIPESDYGGVADYSAALSSMAHMLTGGRVTQSPESPYEPIGRVGRYCLNLIRPWALSASPRYFDPTPYLKAIK